MNLTLTTRQAYAEIDEFLSIINVKEKEKIPIELRQIFKAEKDRQYVKKIDPNIPIDKQNLREETLNIIAMLNLKYWCQNDEEKKELIKIYQANEEKYQEILSEKYNPDNLFKNRKKELIQDTEQAKEEVALVEYKDSIIKRIFSKIRRIFFIKD